MRKFLLCLLLILFFSYLSNSQTILLDTTFGTEGKVATGLNLNNAGTKLALQSDGKTVVVGGNTNGDFVVARYNTDGTPDNSFGTTGIVTTDFGSADNASGVVIAQDGTIIVVGTSGADFALAAYNSSDGTLNSSFGTSGKVTTDFGGTDSCKGVALQSDGKIVAVGSSTSVITLDYALARYDTDGSLDNTFGTGGIVTTDFNGLADEANAVAIQSDGKIVACGTSTDLLQTRGADFSVARYNSDGSLNIAFANNGQLVYDFLGLNNYAYALAIQPDGRIIVVGSLSRNIEALPGVMAIFRLKTDGTFDSTFNQDGIRRGRFADFQFSSAHAVTLQSDGKILVGGFAFNKTGEASFAVMRLRQEGYADSSFALGQTDLGHRGRITTSFDSSIAAGFDIAVQPDGKIVVGGIANNSTDPNNNEIALLRYLSHYTMLPLDFTSFSLMKNQKSITLNWKVANEINNSYFLVERSSKGNTGFIEIGRVTSKGNSNVQQYTFEDLAPIVGGNFYRLKQVDLDGHSTYSIILYAGFSKGIVIRLYPNPIADRFTIDGLKEGSTTILSILNLQGNVLSKATTTNGSYNWNIKQMAAGPYFVRVEVDGHMTTLKFVKQ